MTFVDSPPGTHPPPPALLWITCAFGAAVGVANEKPGGSAEPPEAPEPPEPLEGEPSEEDEPLPGDSPA